MNSRTPRSRSSSCWSCSPPAGRRAMAARCSWWAIRCSRSTASATRRSACSSRRATQGIGAGARLRPLRLTRNFRSAPALVSWTNELFAQVFRRSRRPARRRGRLHAKRAGARRRRPSSPGSRRYGCALFPESRAPRPARSPRAWRELRQQDPHGTRRSARGRARARRAASSAALEARGLECAGSGPRAAG